MGFVEVLRGWGDGVGGGEQTAVFALYRDFLAAPLMLCPEKRPKC